MNKEEYLEIMLNSDEPEIILNYLVALYKNNYDFYKKRENIHHNLITALNIKKITKNSQNTIKINIYEKIIKDIELIRKEIVKNA